MGGGFTRSSTTASGSDRRLIARLTPTGRKGGNGKDRWAVLGRQGSKLTERFTRRSSEPSLTVGPVSRRERLPTLPSGFSVAAGLRLPPLMRWPEEKGFGCTADV